MGTYLVICLLRAPDGTHRSDREVDPGKRDEVRLELAQIHVEGTAEPEGTRDRAGNLGYHPEAIRVRPKFNKPGSLCS